MTRTAGCTADYKVLRNKNDMAKGVKSGQRLRYEAAGWKIYALVSYLETKSGNHTRAWDREIKIGVVSGACV